MAITGSIIAGRRASAFVRLIVAFLNLYYFLLVVSPRVQSIGLDGRNFSKFFGFAHTYGMAVYNKVYVAMILRVDMDGKMKPIEVEWENGERFLITKIVDVRQAPPQHVGSGPTIRYTVKISGRAKEIFYESFNNKWFVEKLVSLD